MTTIVYLMKTKLLNTIIYLLKYILQLIKKNKINNNSLQFYI